MQLVYESFEELFLENQDHLKKMFVYMCQQCTALEDPISNVACQFLSGRLHISLGVSGVAFFEDGIIYPYFYMSQTQRRFLYQLVGPSPATCSARSGTGSATGASC